MDRTWFEVHIEAPVDKVFAFIADPANLSREKVGSDLVYEDVRLAPDGVGTTYRAAGRIAGTHYEVEGRYTEVVPGERIVDEVSGGLPGTFVYTFEAEGSGTRLTIEHSSAAIDRIPLLGHLIEREMARAHEPAFARVKALLEARAAA